MAERLPCTSQHHLHHVYHAHACLPHLQPTQATCDFNSTTRTTYTQAGATHLKEMCNLYLMVGSLPCGSGYAHVERVLCRAF